jgi:hypothetical protein
VKCGIQCSLILREHTVRRHYPNYSLSMQSDDNCWRVLQSWSVSSRRKSVRSFSRAGREEQACGSRSAFLLYSFHTSSMNEPSILRAELRYGAMLMAHQTTRLTQRIHMGSSFRFVRCRTSPPRIRSSKMACSSTGRRPVLTRLTPTPVHPKAYFLGRAGCSAPPPRRAAAAAVARTESLSKT